jgi:hypothetical protein
MVSQSFGALSVVPKKKLMKLLQSGVAISGSERDIDVFVGQQFEIDNSARVRCTTKLGYPSRSLVTLKPMALHWKWDRTILLHTRSGGGMSHIPRTTDRNTCAGVL